MKYQKVSRIVEDPSSAMAYIYNHIRKVDSLHKILHQCLDKALTSHCQIAHFENGQLTIAVKNIAFATRLRFLAPDLISDLKKYEDFESLKTIRCFVLLEHDTETIERKVNLSLSKANKDALKETAKNIKNKALKEALIRLSEEDYRQPHNRSPASPSPGKI